MINIEALKEYTQFYPEILGKLFNGNTVLGDLVPHTGANPGKYAFRLYEADGTFSDCCTVPKGESALKEVETDVACILSGNEFCDVDLAKALGNAKFRFTAGQESAPSVEALFMDQELKAIAKNIDKLVFQGDKDSENANLNKINGFLKQAAKAKQVDVSTKTSAYEQVLTVVEAIEDEAEDMGEIGIFVSLGYGRKLKGELIEKNLYHYNPGMGEKEDRFYLPGFSNIVIIPTRGMNGSDNLFVSPLNNLHWVTNLETDHMDMEWDYANYEQKYFWRVKFIIGVAIGIMDYAILAKTKA